MKYSFCVRVGEKILYLRSGFIDFKIKYKGKLKEFLCYLSKEKYFRKGKMLVSAFFSLPSSLFS